MIYRQIWKIKDARRWASAAGTVFRQRCLELMGVGCCSRDFRGINGPIKPAHLFHGSLDSFQVWEALAAPPLGRLRVHREAHLLHLGLCSPVRQASPKDEPPYSW